MPLVSGSLVSLDPKPRHGLFGPKSDRQARAHTLFGGLSQLQWPRTLEQLSKSMRYP